MPIDYTSAGLIASVKRRAMIPNSQQLYSDSEIVQILSEVLWEDILPQILAVRESYFIHDYDQSVDSDTNKYEFPTRAVGNKLKDVVLLNSDGKEVVINRLETSYLKHERGIYASDYYGHSRGYFIEDDNVVLYPDATYFTQYSLRMKYYRRPNQIIKTTDAGQITAINTSTKVVTLSRLDSDWDTDTTFDAVKSKPHFRSRGDDNSITALDNSAKTLTFSSLPSGLAVGDWVSEAGTSPVAQIPFEYFGLLAQRAAIKTLEGIGDSEGLAAAANVYNDMRDKMQVMLTPRVDGSPKKIVSSGRLFGGRWR